MLNFYQEIKLLPEEEIPIHFLWSKVIGQIHLGLVEMQDENKLAPIGVSFPGYVTGEKHSVLGDKCRLFAVDEATLAQFNAAKWLARLTDYVHCTSLRPVPEKLNGYALFQREQPKASIERLARRYARHHNVDYESALKRYSNTPHKIMSSPFIRLKSLSSDKTFCLWIKKTNIPKPQGNVFSSYGLSATSTVPDF
ncbi:MAG: type I-F CRISPR-associated endoribonuclease Cas6/Csy4 [Methylococcaceae bacterium]|jgi:CRISPR-associated endonuclease Csy4